MQNTVLLVVTPLVTVWLVNLFVQVIIETQINGVVTPLL